MKILYLFSLILVYLLAGCIGQPPATSTTTAASTTHATVSTAAPTSTLAPTTTLSPTTTVAPTTTAMQTTTTIAAGSAACDAHCKAINYIGGVCRLNEQECHSRREIESAYQRGLCPGSQLDTCCCRNSASLENGSTIGY